jgi:hypothetical protein
MEERKQQQKRDKIRNQDIRTLGKYEHANITKNLMKFSMQWHEYILCRDDNRIPVRANGRRLRARWREKIYKKKQISNNVREHFWEGS